MKNNKEKGSMKTKQWHELTKLQQLQCIYSDTHKDVYGFRPRNEPTENLMSVAWLEMAIGHLEKNNGFGA